VEWEVLFDEDFNIWFDDAERGLRLAIVASIEVLRQLGPNLGRPRVDSVKGSDFSNMKEMRIQYHGDPWRILFAFDPRRRAILLVGGNKKGDARWYESNILIADRRFKRHLEALEREG
jgi:hypothetical protein